MQLRPALQPALKPALARVIGNGVSSVAQISRLLASITPDWWYAPTAESPGWDAVTESSIFTRTGTATGFYTGPRGQEIVRQPTSGTHYATAGSSVFDAIANPWKQLSNASQFWVMVLFNPRGNTYGFNGAFATGASTNTQAGVRAYINGTNGNITCQISDGVGRFTGVGTCWEYDANLTNAYLIQFDLGTPYMNFWANGFADFSSGSGYRPITGLSWSGTPISNGNALQIGSALGLYAQGDIMACGGRGVLSDRTAAALMNYGRGLRYSDLEGLAHSETDFFRAIVDSDDTAGTKLRIAGKWESDPTLNLYAQGVDKHTRGSLVATSGTLTRDSNKRATHLFSGLTNDANYQLVVSFGDVEATLEGRYKAMPSGFDGLKFVASGCWDFDRSTLARKSAYSQAFNNIYRRGVDTFVTLGDDIYGDLTWTRELSESGTPQSRADMERVADNQEPVWQLQRAARSLLWSIGPQSDHCLMGDDQEYDAANMETAVQYTRDRYGNLTYPATGKLYRSWRTPGLTWIAIDTRTEIENGVQMMSVAQISWLESELTSAVGRGDFIMLLTEKPFNPGGTPGPQQWNYTATPAFQTQRTALFDAIVSSGASSGSHNQVLILCSDYHANGVDDGTNQSGFDTGAITQIPTIMSARLVHGFAESASENWSEYFNNGEGGFPLIELADNAGDCDVTVTPYQGNTAQTPINFHLALA